MSALLEIADLHATVAGREILRGVDLSIDAGEVHALMGPNGSGKSTLGHVLAGRHGYAQTSGSVTLAGDDLLALPAHERARRGLFVAFQYPVEIPGVGFVTFLTEAADAMSLPVDAVVGAPLEATASRLGLEHVLDRAVNEDLSGGEKKRSEAMQLALLRPKLVILDEIDSGLDVDGVRLVADEVMALVRGSDAAVLVITHYVRILKYIAADHAHVLLDGRIVRNGGPELADELEQTGYEQIRADVAGDESGAAAGIFDL